MKEIVQEIMPEGYVLKISSFPIAVAHQEMKSSGGKSWIITVLFLVHEIHHLYWCVVRSSPSLTPKAELFIVAI